MSYAANDELTECRPYIVLRLRLGSDPALQGAAGAVPGREQHTHVRTSIHAVLGK